MGSISWTRASSSIQGLVFLPVGFVVVLLADLAISLASMNATSAPSI